MAGEVVVDALPYIDQGYDEPGVREATIRLFGRRCAVSGRCCQHGAHFNLARHFAIHGKAIIDKWNNILDRQVKYLKKPEDEKGTGFEAKSIKKYIYNDQLGFHAGEH
uniref:(California timema) hypothetical protein n=1 Tax=Timema californicum TaxID=61474 RepID=A0A7R9J450_TIMCA|nr:unnamed protein product [Timema californicum]